MQVQAKAMQMITATPRSVISDAPKATSPQQVQAPQPSPTVFPQISSSLPQDGTIKQDLKLVGKALSKGMTPQFPDLAPKPQTQKDLVGLKTSSKSSFISPSFDVKFEGSPITITGAPGLSNRP